MTLFDSFVALFVIGFFILVVISGFTKQSFGEIIARIKEIIGYGGEDNGKKTK